jgi:hypothetical protein
MRLWDIHPGYLNRQSLLGEHRELHGVVSIIVNQKKGYARHPETRRWVGFGWALQQRHRLLAVEMALRGYTDRSPVTTDDRPGVWPDDYIDCPDRQFTLLAIKYRDRASGRIPLPVNAQQLWRQHKYSVMARDVERYRGLGQEVARMKPRTDRTGLALELTELLRKRPSEKGMKNALLHMWGYISDACPGPNADIDTWPLDRLLREIQQRTLSQAQPYLLHSTALSELAAW